VIGKFHRVADQIERHLPQPRAVAIDPNAARRQLRMPGQPFLLGHLIADRDHRLQHLDQVERLLIQPELAGLAAC
jgi:hypothetical protein